MLKNEDEKFDSVSDNEEEQYIEETEEGEAGEAETAEDEEASEDEEGYDEEEYEGEDLAYNNGEEGTNTPRNMPSKKTIMIIVGCVVVAIIVIACFAFGGSGGKGKGDKDGSGTSSVGTSTEEDIRDNPQKDDGDFAVPSTKIPLAPKTQPTFETKFRDFTKTVETPLGLFGKIDDPNNTDVLGPGFIAYSGVDREYINQPYPEHFLYPDMKGFNWFRGIYTLELPDYVEPEQMPVLESGEAYIIAMENGPIVSGLATKFKISKEMSAGLQQGDWVDMIINFDDEATAVYSYGQARNLTALGEVVEIVEKDGKSTIKLSTGATGVMDTTTDVLTDAYWGDDRSLEDFLEVRVGDMVQFIYNEAADSILDRKDTTIRELFLIGPLDWTEPAGGAPTEDADGGVDGAAGGTGDVLDAEGNPVFGE